MQQVMDKIETLVEEYEDALLEKGLICSVSKKYFETKVSLSSHHSYTLLDNIFRHIAYKRESKYFKHQRNRQHCAVLCFCPANKEFLKKSECKEYAFALYEVFRHEEGFSPKEKIYNEKTVLNKIEKRIRKVLKSAEKKSAVRICKCTKFDLLRYFFKTEYGYKKTIFGIDRNTLDTIFSVSFIVVFLIIILIVYLNTK